MDLQETQRRFEEYATLVEIGKALTSTLDLEEILGLIMEKVSYLLKPKAWSLLLLDPKTDELTFEIAVSHVAEQLKGRRLKVGTGVAGWVAKHGQPLLIPDVAEDPRFADEIDRAVSFRTASIICIPISIRNRILGVIEVLNSLDEGTFSEGDLQILLTIADYAAIAIENAQYFNEIRNLVITDDLTGLYNARHFHQVLDYEVERAERYGTDVSLVFFDLDHFKRVNDTYGHLSGSRLLSEIGHVIRGSIRKVDIAARFGGDEFVIILPNTSKEGAVMVATALRNRLKDHKFHTDDGDIVTITASFGVASYPADTRDRVELVALADKAMYSVKESSRDGVCAA